MDNPKGASEQVHRILKEGRLIAFNRVAEELEPPADAKQRERPVPLDEEEERQANDDHRDADAVREPVQRMLMLLLVILHERCRHIHLPLAAVFKSRSQHLLQLNFGNQFTTNNDRCNLLRITGAQESFMKDVRLSFPYAGFQQGPTRRDN